MIDAEEAREISEDKHKRNIFRRAQTKVRFWIDVIQINTLIKRLADRRRHRALYETRHSDERCLGMLLEVLHKKGYSVEVYESDFTDALRSTGTVYLLEIEWRGLYE